MAIQDDFEWFLDTFHDELQHTARHTPYPLPVFLALAYQETGWLWSHLRKQSLPTERILELCVGDTIDARYVRGRNTGRRAFPKNKADLLTHPQGQQMFDIARCALVGLARYGLGYASVAANPDKFCRGFGIFQLDLQHLNREPDYFLARQWTDFSRCLDVCLAQLQAAQQRVGLDGKCGLQHEELVRICIAYNRGRLEPSLGLRQGHKDASGKYYGEYIDEYLQLAATLLQDSGEIPGPPPPATQTPRMEIPACSLTTSRPVGRSGRSWAHSLKEAGQPTRTGEAPEHRRLDLHTIIQWLDVANPAHIRWKPVGNKTFCNVYAHDYCHLAGAYLPRVWWHKKAIQRLRKGEAVRAKYAETVVEMRANDLYDWLGEYGEAFGWRQETSLTALQGAANDGNVCLIVARYADARRSGHIVAVAPETAAHPALRNASHRVTIPVQSQAGRRNYRYTTAVRDWWNHARYEGASFWVHE